MSIDQLNKTASDALQFSSQEILAIVPTPAMFIGTDGRIAHVNPLLDRRIEPQNLVGESVFDVVRSSSKARLEVYVRKVLEESSVDLSVNPAIEIELIAGDIRLLMNACRDVAGNCAGFLARLDKFSDERSSEFLLDAFVAGKIGIWHYRVDVDAHFQSRSWWRLRGYDAEADRPFVWDDWIERVHPDDRAVVSSPDERYDGLIVLRYRERHQSGKWMWILSRGRVTVRDKHGVPHAYEGFDTDITQIVEAEEERAAMALELSHAQRLQSLGQLSGGVAHDFNNLLAVVLGSAQLLAYKNEEANVHLRNIIDASTRGSKLTQHLLAFSRKQALHPESTDLNQLLSGMRYLISQAVGDGVTVELDMPTDQWRCFADGLQLENAVLNLALNASDAMLGAGVLKIKASNCLVNSELCAELGGIQPGEYALIEVIDSGKGIEQEIASRAFEPFFTTKQSGEGSGLGLSMVFGFVKQSGGHVDLKSNRDEGTTVRVFLPRSTMAASTPSVLAGPMQAAEDTRSVIVVVEDDLNVQYVVVSMLEKLGYQAKAFSCGDEALAGLNKDENVDLLLSDIRLPGGIDGHQLGTRMLERFPHIKVVHMSGYSDQAVQATVQEGGAWPLIHKPFGVNALAEIIAAALTPPSGSARTHVKRVLASGIS